MPLLHQVLPQEPQRSLMPFQCFATASMVSLFLEIGFDGVCNGHCEMVDLEFRGMLALLFAKRLRRLAGNLNCRHMWSIGLILDDRLILFSACYGLRM